MVVSTLALGIGVATAGFTLASWVLFRTPPGITDAGRLGTLWFGDAERSGPFDRYIVTASRLDEVARVGALSGLAGYTRLDVTAGANGQGRRLEAEFVMGGYFAVLGTIPALGRLLSPEDDFPPAGSAVAVIGHHLWRDLFNGDPAVLGQTLRVNTGLFTIVGIAPEGFHGAEQRSTELWLPGHAQSSVLAALGDRVPVEAAYREFVARLAPGATFSQAEEQLRVQSQRAFGLSATLSQGVGIWAPVRASAENAARLVVAITTLLVLIAAANAADLMLFRSLERRAQVATRKVLGARTRDVLGGHLCEGLILAIAAAIGGVVLSRWFVSLFKGLSLWRGGPSLPQVPFDWRVAAFALSVAGGCTLLCSLVSVLVVSRTAGIDAIRLGTQGITRGQRLRRVFAGLQVALSVPLLVGALLLSQTLWRLGKVELGFDPTDVYMFHVAPGDQGYEQTRVERYYRDLVSAVRDIPGTESVSLAFTYPLATGGPFTLMPARPTGPQSVGQGDWALVNRVSNEYFRTLSIPLLAGRGFRNDEELVASGRLPRVAIVSRSLGRRLFDDRDPVGEFVGRDPRYEVVGVVGDTHWRALETNREPFSGGIVYTPFVSRQMGRGVLLIRSGRPAVDLVSAVRAAAREIDSSVPLYGETTMEDTIERNLWDRILLERLLIVLSTLSVLLVCVGLYGLVAFTVTTQQREMGIRMALGASNSQVVAGVLREGLMVAGAGALLGLAGAIVLAKLLQGHLYGVASSDIRTMSLTVLGTFGIAVLSTLPPAHAATRVDPAGVLRVE